MQDISPLHCLRQCGRKYRYGSLQEGNICLCANSLPTAKVDDSECNMRCPGYETWPSDAQASLRYVFWLCTMFRLIKGWDGELAFPSCFEPH